MALRLFSLLSVVALWAICGTSDTASARQEGAAKPQSLIGRWDLTVTTPDGKYPSWLEIRKSGRQTLVGSFVAQFGSARPISKVEWNNGTFRFSIPPQWEARKDDITHEGKLVGDLLQGESTDEKGRKITWEGRRAPTLKRAEAPKWGEPIEIFNGKDLTGFKPRYPENKHGWEVKDGVLVNANPGNDLLTEKTFSDFQLKAEFRYPKGSNSGIYLRGRYEFQIEDNKGLEADSHLIGGIYGFLTPSLNAAKKADEWQEVQITLVGRVITVVLNGELIIDRQTIPGITGGAIDSDEGNPGPLMLQGDHGRVEFRKLILTPAQEAK